MAASMISRHAAVIGAGAAGLVAARELRHEGHRVTVFERGSRVGGTWVYTPGTERDPLGIDPSRPVVHSSLYKSLRTNRPREVMGFRDYSFLPRADGLGDPRRYPGHEEVLAYLEDFAREFGLEEMVRFEEEIIGVGMAEEGGYWKVTWRMRNGGGGREEEVFDAVVVCNGHYTEPRIAEIPGIDDKYHFPFLETDGIVTIDDNRVEPFYKHIFPPHLTPWLSFVGLPWKVNPFPQFEYQSKWIAGALSGRIALPSEEEMMEDVKDFYSQLEASGVSKPYTHNLADSQSGSRPSEEWRREMYSESSRNRRARPDAYRDEGGYETLVSQAHEDFAKHPSHR